MLQLAAGQITAFEQVKFGMHNLLDKMARTKTTKMPFLSFVRHPILACLKSVWQVSS